ncbi:hypothetical protein Pmani_009700 [Petrolisthes manimaculis]|uniref:Uncharacterized protein n=1 Tax=Petrolisthes manimaculis TaxID=1843537 RepID=A0AAE1UDE2_9EUCA|nr:hypothetical protein Pmani_009700 [Petrolisthes manimaculis]
MAECAKVAAENANISANKYKSYFDLKSQNRQFRPGDEVLVLLPDCSNKLLVSWNGPFKVLERRNRVNYLIDDKGNAKLYHANLLKRYYRRTNVSLSQVLDENPVSEEYNHYNPLTVQFCIKDEHDEIDDCELPITPDGKEFNSTSEGLYFCQGPGIEASPATYPTADTTLGNPRHRSCYYCVLAPAPTTSSTSSHPSTLCLDIGGPESTYIDSWDSKLPLGSGHLRVLVFGRELVLPVLSVLGARKMTLVNY